MRMERYLQVAMAAAREAGRIQMEHFGHCHPVQYKGEFNPVTEIDKACDRVITRMILDAFPDHDILSEESPFEGKGSRWKWIVDPLDGTTNYLRGFPVFAVSIGLEVEGEIKVGVVYYPALEQLFHAERGEGAYLNEERIDVSRVSELNKSFLCTGFPYDVQTHVDLYLSYFRQFITRSFAIRRPGSAAIDLCYVAAGKFDGFWELKLHPWDVAAGSLLVIEAGGRVTGFRGQPFDIYSEEILASNGCIHDQMLEVMREINEERRAINDGR